MTTDDELDGREPTKLILRIITGVCVVVTVAIVVMILLVINVRRRPHRKSAPDILVRQEHPSPVFGWGQNPLAMQPCELMTITNRIDAQHGPHLSGDGLYWTVCTNPLCSSAVASGKL